MLYFLSSIFYTIFTWPRSAVLTRTQKKNTCYIFFIFYDRHLIEDFQLVIYMFKWGREKKCEIKMSMVCIGIYWKYNLYTAICT